jgi:arginine exporter protein ArgO
MFGAALVFREGIHSDSPMGWIVLTIAIDVLIFTGAVLGIWVLIVRSREKRLRRTEESGR